MADEMLREICDPQSERYGNVTQAEAEALAQEVLLWRGAARPYLDHLPGCAGKFDGYECDCGYESLLADIGMAYQQATEAEE